MHQHHVRRLQFRNELRRLFVVSMSRKTYGISSDFHVHVDTVFYFKSAQLPVNQFLLQYLIPTRLCPAPLVQWQWPGSCHFSTIARTVAKNVRFRAGLEKPWQLWDCRPFEFPLFSFFTSQIKTGKYGRFLFACIFWKCQCISAQGNTANKSGISAHSYYCANTLLKSWAPHDTCPLRKLAVEHFLPVLKFVEFPKLNWTPYQSLAGGYRPHTCFPLLECGPIH